MNPLTFTNNRMKNAQNAARAITFELNELKIKYVHKFESNVLGGELFIFIKDESLKSKIDKIAKPYLSGKYDPEKDRYVYDRTKPINKTAPIIRTVTVKVIK